MLLKKHCFTNLVHDSALDCRDGLRCRLLADSCQLHTNDSIMLRTTAQLLTHPQYSHQPTARVYVMGYTTGYLFHACNELVNSLAFKKRHSCLQRCNHAFNGARPPSYPQRATAVSLQQRTANIYRHLFQLHVRETNTDISSFRYQSGHMCR